MMMDAASEGKNEGGLVGPDFEGARSFLSRTDAASQAAATLLLEAGQQHLFRGWSRDTAEDAEAARLLDQVVALDKQYPGGIKTYAERSRALLTASASGLNPFEGFAPTIPAGERLNLDTDAPTFHRMEALGMTQMHGACFVLVAGGLGERLGYNGIKVMVVWAGCLHALCISRWLGAYACAQCGA